MEAAGRQRRRLLAALASVVICASLLAFTHITDPDLGFHLATGRAVLALGRIPATNVLSFTEPEHPWILHEWLPAVLFELAWRKSGPAGVLALRVIVVAGTWPLVLLAARRLGASPIAAGIATLIGAGAAALRFTDRPQIFSNLALAGCALLLADAAKVQGGHRRIRRVAVAGLVAAGAAQVHAGAVTSFALLACVAVGVAIEPLRARLFHDEVRGPSGLAAAGWVAAITAAAIGLAALVLALYHPHGARPLLVAFQLGADADLREHVAEYRPPLQSAVPCAPRLLGIRGDRRDHRRAPRQAPPRGAPRPLPRVRGAVAPPRAHRRRVRRGGRAGAGARPRRPGADSHRVSARSARGDRHDGSAGAGLAARSLGHLPAGARHRR